MPRDGSLGGHESCGFTLRPAGRCVPAYGFCHVLGAGWAAALAVWDVGGCPTSVGSRRVYEGSPGSWGARGVSGTAPVWGWRVLVGSTRFWDGGHVVSQADEFGVPRVPDGRYAVRDPDPAQGGRWTLWATRDGQLRDFPEETRWRPMPPKFEHLRGDERREARNDWYSNTYWGWRRDVAQAVLADPAGCAEAFQRVASSTPLPEAARWGGGELSARRRQAKVPAVRLPSPESEAARRRREEQTLATALASAGRSVRQIAAELGVSKSTAQRRVQAAGVQASDTVARALLLVRVGDLERTFARPASGADEAKRAAALADLQRIRAVLQGGMTQ